MTARPKTWVPYGIICPTTFGKDCGRFEAACRRALLTSRAPARCKVPHPFAYSRKGGESQRRDLFTPSARVPLYPVPRYNPSITSDKTRGFSERSTMSKNPHFLHRRDLIKRAALLAGGVGVTVATDKDAKAADSTVSHVERPDKSTPCLFTKPLGNRKVGELPAILNELSIDAVDLTCRPGGHVLPERVTDDLPRAIEQLRKAGIDVAMLTTAILDADQGHAEQIIATAGKLGIRYIKLGYYDYADIRRVLPSISEAHARLKDVIALCREHNVHAGYHNHSGKPIGAAMWDVWHLLLGTSARDAGSYFDLRHATVEGGLSGWQIGMNLLAPRITMLAIKDFLWERNKRGRWMPQNVPLGQGMVRLTEGLGQLAELGFAGPVSLHVEYVSPKVAPGSDEEKRNFQSIRQDWQTMTSALAKAKLI